MLVNAIIFEKITCFTDGVTLCTLHVRISVTLTGASLLYFISYLASLLFLL